MRRDLLAFVVVLTTKSDPSGVPLLVNRRARIATARRVAAGLAAVGPRRDEVAVGKRRDCRIDLISRRGAVDQEFAAKPAPIGIEQLSLMPAGAVSPTPLKSIQVMTVCPLAKAAASGVFWALAVLVLTMNSPPILTPVPV